MKSKVTGSHRFQPMMAWWWIQHDGCIGIQHLCHWDGELSRQSCTSSSSLKSWGRLLGCSIYNRGSTGQLHRPMQLQWGRSGDLVRLVHQCMRYAYLFVCKHFGGEREQDCCFLSTAKNEENTQTNLAFIFHWAPVPQNVCALDMGNLLLKEYNAEVGCLFSKSLLEGVNMLFACYLYQFALFNICWRYIEKGFSPAREGLLVVCRNVGWWMWIILASTMKLRMPFKPYYLIFTE